MKVQIVNKSNNKVPMYKHEGDAGMDLRADIEQSEMLYPGERKLIPTGLHIALPNGYEARIQSRSGLAAKNGVFVLNSPGCVDSSFRGDIGVILFNSSNQAFEIHPGDRIAQMIISKYEQVEWEEVETLSETQRGSGGFGSSGIA